MNKKDNPSKIQEIDLLRQQIDNLNSSLDNNLNELIAYLDDTLYNTNQTKQNKITNEHIDQFIQTENKQTIQLNKIKKELINLLQSKSDVKVILPQDKQEEFNKIISQIKLTKNVSNVKQLYDQLQLLLNLQQLQRNKIRLENDAIEQFLNNPLLKYNNMSRKETIEIENLRKQIDNINSSLENNLNELITYIDATLTDQNKIANERIQQFLQTENEQTVQLDEMKKRLLELLQPNSDVKVILPEDQQEEFNRINTRINNIKTTVLKSTNISKQLPLLVKLQKLQREKRRLEYNIEQFYFQANNLHKKNQLLMADRLREEIDDLNSQIEKNQQIQDKFAEDTVQVDKENLSKDQRQQAIQSAESWIENQDVLIPLLNQKKKELEQLPPTQQQQPTYAKVIPLSDTQQQELKNINDQIRKIKRTIYDRYNYVKQRQGESSAKIILADELKLNTNLNTLRQRKKQLENDIHRFNLQAESRIAQQKKAEEDLQKLNNRIQQFQQKYPTKQFPILQNKKKELELQIETLKSVHDKYVEAKQKQSTPDKQQDFLDPLAQPSEPEPEPKPKPEPEPEPKPKPKPKPKPARAYAPALAFAPFAPAPESSETIKDQLSDLQDEIADNTRLLAEFDKKRKDLFTRIQSLQSERQNTTFEINKLEKNTQDWSEKIKNNRNKEEELIDDIKHLQIYTSIRDNDEEQEQLVEPLVKLFQERDKLEKNKKTLTTNQKKRLVILDKLVEEQEAKINKANQALSSFEDFLRSQNKPDTEEELTDYIYRLRTNNENMQKQIDTATDTKEKLLHKKNEINHEIQQLNKLNQEFHDQMEALYKQIDQKKHTISQLALQIPKSKESQLKPLSPTTTPATAAATSTLFCPQLFATRKKMFSSQFPYLTKITKTKTNLNTKGGSTRRRRQLKTNSLA